MIDNLLQLSKLFCASLFLSILISDYGDIIGLTKIANDVLILTYSLLVAVTTIQTLYLFGIITIDSQPLIRFFNIESSVRDLTLTLSFGYVGVAHNLKYLAIPFKYLLKLFSGPC